MKLVSSSPARGVSEAPGPTYPATGPPGPVGAHRPPGPLALSIRMAQDRETAAGVRRMYNSTLSLTPEGALRYPITSAKARKTRRRI